ncbi:MAG: PilN domain-containing protein [Nitrospirae bacterium]|nr:PilN domain-containing protein [Nitrospirota bacterium]MBI5695032.1 PilN domain-containing protein [Nitrospirota bacterium]
MRISINFSPKEHVYVRKVYAALAVCLFAASSVFAAGYGAYSRAESRVAPLKAKAGSLEAEIKAVDRKLAEAKKTVDPSRSKSDALQVEFVNSAIRQKSFSWTAFLNRVEGLVPDGVGITAIRPEFTTLNVEITGKADGIGQALKFVEVLTRSRYFDDIPPVFHTTEVLADKDVGKTVQQFSIRIRYYPDGRPGAAPVPQEAGTEEAGTDKDAAGEGD